VDWHTHRVSPDYEPGLGPHVHCSRSLARRGRALVERDVFQRLHPEFKAMEWLPRSCPLWPGNDVLLEQEMHKEKLSRGSSHDWHCKICGKKFRSEFFLDRHLDHKHTHGGHRTDGNDTTNTMHCPAENCALFGGCFGGPLTHRFDSAEEDDAVMRTMQSWLRSHACSTADMPKVRQKCRSVLSQCFPREGPRSSNSTAEGELRVERPELLEPNPSAGFWEAVAQLELAAHGDAEDPRGDRLEEAPPGVFDTDVTEKLLYMLCDSMTCKGGMLHRPIFGANAAAMKQRQRAATSGAAGYPDDEVDSGPSMLRIAAVTVVVILCILWMASVIGHDAESLTEIVERIGAMMGRGGRSSAGALDRLEGRIGHQEFNRNLQKERHERLRRRRT